MDRSGRISLDGGDRRISGDGMKVKRKRVTFLGRRSGRPDRKVTFYVRPRPKSKEKRG